MNQAELARVLVALGCPDQKSEEMAGQLQRNGHASSPGRKGEPEEEALAHLLSLMRQGWAAKERGW
jgi:hypothetical protein